MYLGWLLQQSIRDENSHRATSVSLDNHAPLTALSFRCHMQVKNDADVETKEAQMCPTARKHNQMQVLAFLQDRQRESAHLKAGMVLGTSWISALAFCWSSASSRLDSMYATPDCPSPPPFASYIHTRVCLLISVQFHASRCDSH